MLAPRRLRWGFDARLAGLANTGIGRYSEEILQRVLGRRPDVDWVVWVRTAQQLPWLAERVKTAAAQGITITIRVANIPHYSVAEQSWWVAELLAARLDLLHVPHFNVPLLYYRPFVVTIHDLLWHTQADARATTLPPWQHRLKHYGYRWVSESAIRRARAVIVPSQAVRGEIERLVPSATAIHVIPEGVPAIYLQAPVWTEADRHHQPSPFFIYVGNLYPHKNLIVVLQALRQLPTLHLKIIGARSVFTDQIRKQAQALGVLPQLDFCGFVPDEEMLELYRMAIALVQPSLSEGFGLPVLESLAVGCPVIAAATPVFREVGQQLVQYVDPLDAAAWTTALQHQWQQPPTINWRQRAQAYAQSFTWEKAAMATSQVYDEVV